MYHSITISGKNLYDEWGLIPTSRPLVNPPEVKTTYVKNPASDGSIDFTDGLTGNTQYSSRKGSWEFWIRPEDQWADVYSAVMNYLHGIEHDVILEDEPKSTYHGRLSVSSWKSDKHNSLLVIDYQLDPYKEVTGNYDNIIPENFFNIPEQYITLHAKFGCNRLIKINNNCNYDIYPRIYVSYPITISPVYIDNLVSTEEKNIFLIKRFDSFSVLSSYQLSEGYNDKINDLVLHPGDNFWQLEISESNAENTLEYVVVKFGFRVMIL